MQPLLSRIRTNSSAKFANHVKTSKEIRWFKSFQIEIAVKKFVNRQVVKSFFNLDIFPEFFVPNFSRKN